MDESSGLTVKINGDKFLLAKLISLVEVLRNSFKMAFIAKRAHLARSHCAIIKISVECHGEVKHGPV